MIKPPTHAELTDSLARSKAREAVSRRDAFEAGAWLAAIVEDSDDAILSKTLGGTIITWNAGAERLFGYTAYEAIGRPITLIIPEDRLHEEEAIIRRIRAAERVGLFETVRRHKDGYPVNVALTVSPVKNEAGDVLGASKIARDISAAKQAAARQDLIIREMNHRIKNLFTLTSSLVALSARGTSDAGELARDLTARLQSLSRAQALTLPNLYEDVVTEAGTTLPALLREVLAPHADTSEARIGVSGDPVPVGQHAVPTLGLLFHELATNAAKYGALASETGRLRVSIQAVDGTADIRWQETGGPVRDSAVPVGKGFGSRLEQASVVTLRGSIERDWQDGGLGIHVRFPLDQIAY
ncbi:MAG: PAS domain S-box protein [Sphingomonas adhaesiva]|uniref:sensor histidine kinase n=1 Tax=Sphingomonas adhaesiva TaxID=28212 RepID=UPI002FF8C3A0